MSILRSALLLVLFVCMPAWADNATSTVQKQYLDEVQDEIYQKNVLAGDAAVERESSLYINKVKAQRTKKSFDAQKPLIMSLNGDWLMKGSGQCSKQQFYPKRSLFQESQGVREHWFGYGYDRNNWIGVDVPTSVQNALVKAGEIEDPLWNTNTWDELQKYGEPNQYPWHFRKTRIERQEWWFARTFSLSEEWKNKTVRLYFDGIDIAGSVYLNGYSLGYHRGMFGGPEYDVTRLLNFNKPNELVVRLDAAPYDWDGILKGSPGWGWHYGHLVSIGIWRDVLLQEVKKYELLNPFVRTESISKDKAVLTIEYYIDNTNINPAELTVNGYICGKTFKSDTIKFQNKITAASGKNRYQTQITVDNARLWWPMNYGRQDMYKLELSVIDGRKAVHTAYADFGIRTIKTLPLDGAQEKVDYKWQFVINDVPMFIKGANWCWMDPMLQCDPNKYEHMIELCRRANIQMFRSWGGGIIETDQFYRLCNEKGIMVYQEFPFCWGPPDFPYTDPHMVDDQITRIIKRLRNHPSLIMWGGGNENATIINNDEGLILVGRRCGQYDPSRIFHRTDPCGGSVHACRIYHIGQPIDIGFMTRPAPWYGELGMPSMTNYDETLLYMPQEKLNTWPPDVNDGGWQAHMNCFSYGDMAKTLRYCDYGPVDSWKKYIEYSQIAQGDEIRFATNLQRAGSYANKGGLWFYKASELFPGHSWGVIGYYGCPKLSYYMVKQMYRPQAAFAHSDKYNWEAGEAFEASINVNNDSARPLENSSVTATVYGSDLKPLWAKTYNVDRVPVSSRKQLGKISVILDPEKIKPFLMAVSLRDSNKNLISDQWYWFNYQVKTEEVEKAEKFPAWGMPHKPGSEALKAYVDLPEARLLTLPKTKLGVAIARTGKTGMITVKNETAVPAFNVIIENFPHKYGNFLDENFFCLYPHEQRTITFELKYGKESLDKVDVRAWNAETVALK